MNKAIALSILALASACLAGQACAADARPDAPLWQKLEPAWQAVEGKLIPLVGEQRNRLLIDLVYASVAGNVCPGVSVNAEEFKRAFSRFEDEKYRGMAEEPQKHYEHELLIHYGTYIGLLTAEALADRDAFCLTAKDVKTSGGGPYWELGKAAEK